MSKQNSLANNETFLYKAKPHWIIFIPTIFWLILSFLVYSVGSHYSIGHLRILTSAPLYKLGSWFCFIVASVYGVRDYVRWQFTEYAVTDKRVLAKFGLLQRNTFEILIQKVEGIKIEQSVLGRLLDYGSIIIVGVGGSQDPFINVPAPMRFREKVQQLIDSSHV